MKRALAVLAVLVVAAPAVAAIDPDLLSGLAARSIGPAAMSGRVAAIEAVGADPDTVYVGAATGGVWKSTNGGLTWESVFDDEPVHAIGAIAVFQPSPEVVWVGTGEANVRNSVSIGNGVYRSLDGGRTWTHLGLAGTERVSRIVLHPRDPDVAWVAALGPLWSEGPERGVFKTTDGGATWQKVLYVDPRTGAADLAIDPANPNKLFAAMWDHRRWPWSFRSGGPGSGLYVTVDGGRTWNRRTEDDGLPEGDLGRVGLAVAPSDPRVVYALVEAEESALVRSTDGGVTWETRNAEADVAPRPFYYADLRVDPRFPDRVYSLWSLVSVSDDGGKTLEPLVRWPPVHPDHHAMWIEPGDGETIYLGNDGGVYVSRDRGATWRFVENLPLAQLYHVAVDMETPYNVYFGLQDNGSWRGPSAVWQDGGIRNHHWQLVSFGDGFDTRPDRELPGVGYSMSQEGYLYRWSLETGQEESIRPAPPEGEELRFNWNAALALDPFDAATLYYGSQYVHRSTDRGETWTTISPDLTTDRPEWQRQAESGGLTPDVTGAENFTTLVALAPSPLVPGTIWAGSDDGRLHVTRDGGATWTSVERNVRGVPASTWIPHVEPSPHDAATAFVVFDNHRRGDMTPYVYRTTDAGATWTSLGDDTLRGYALAIVQDPVDPELLFLGTEFGLWVSLDGGGNWLPFAHGLPTASVMDLVVHPRDHDLVVATHGRAVHVVDDVAPLRTLSAETMAAPLHLFPVAPAQQHGATRITGNLAPGHGAFAGENRPYGAILTYSLAGDDLPHPDEEVERERREEERRRERREAAAGEEEEAFHEATERVERSRRPREPAEEEAAEPVGEEPEEEADEEEDEEEEVTIEVLRDGERVRRFTEEAVRGVNRAVWDLASDPFRTPQRDSWWPGGESGPEVPPGTYEVVVRFRGHEARQPVEVTADPRTRLAPEDVAARWAAIQRAGALQETLTTAVERLRGLAADVDLVMAKVDLRKREAEIGEDDEDPWKALGEKAKALRKALREAEETLWTPPDTKGIVAETHAESAIGYALWRLDGSWSAPDATDLAYLDRAERRLGEALAAYRAVYEDELAAFRAAVDEGGLGLFSAAEPVASELAPAPPPGE